MAYLLKLTNAAILALAVAWGAWWWSRGAPATALIGAALIASAFAWLLAIEFVIAFALRPRAGQGAAPLRLASLVRAWAREVIVSPQVFQWRVPWRHDAIADALPRVAPGADGSGRRGLVLVHGFVCNRGIWNPWMRRLNTLGVPFSAVTLEPVFGSIDAYVPGLEAAVARVEAATGLPPVIVAHSMGGLAVRAWLTGEGAAARVHRVVTIATPHAGTWLARFSFSRNGREMRRTSAWLRALREREAPQAARLYARFTCFHSDCDNVVFPFGTAVLPGADNRHLPGRAHVELVYDATVFDEALRLVGGHEPAAAPRGAQPEA